MVPGPATEYQHGVEGVELKNKGHESCALSFIWGKMKTVAWEIASQVALRDLSKEAIYI